MGPIRRDLCMYLSKRAYSMLVYVSCDSLALLQSGQVLIRTLSYFPFIYCRLCVCSHKSSRLIILPSKFCVSALLRDCWLHNNCKWDTQPFAIQVVKAYYKYHFIKPFNSEHNHRSSWNVDTEEKDKHFALNARRPQFCTTFSTFAVDWCNASTFCGMQ